MNRRLLTSVLVSLVGINTLMQAETARPRLVVGIMVDQLRTDYIDYLQGLFGEKGFRRLMENGVYIRDLDFRQSTRNPATAAAVVYTGNWPAATGLPKAMVYDAGTKRSLPVLLDEKTAGNYTTESYSPEALQLSTISDEIAIDGLGLSGIYSIAPDAQTAIVMSGHAGTWATWIDDHSGKWASSTYYKTFPQPLSIKNQYSPLSQRIDTIRWKPSRPLDQYPGLPPQKKYYPFSHGFSKSDRDVWRQFKISAPVNTEVTDAAIECIRQLRPGSSGQGIDMLNIGYTAAPWKNVRDGDVRIELEDIYLRLDDQLGRLFDEIDRTVGLDNTVVYLTSTGYYDDAVADDPKYRIPTGEFSFKRAEGLLNAYLSARHGNGDYIEAIHDSEVYLDHKAIENKQLSASEVRKECREFLMKMSGVRGALTLDEVLSGENPDAATLRLRMDPKQSGDIFLSFSPGWNVVDDINYPTVKTPVRTGQVLTPGFIMAPGVSSEEIVTPVDATAIATTITSTLHIRSPNGSIHRPLPLRRATEK